MKKIYSILCLIFLVIPAWADDDLKPEPLDQAIGEYNDLKKSSDIDPMNHEIWKLYIFYDLSPMSGFDKTPKWLVAGLSPEKGYRVVLPINQLYNFFRPMPKAGDVIVVEGHVIAHYNLSVSTEFRQYEIPALLMNLEGAVNLKGEHFDPLPSPVTPPATSLPVITPTFGVTIPGMPMSTPSGQPLTFGLDVMRPEPMAQAIREYHSFWSTRVIEPSNHEIWKLYLRKTLFAKNDPNHKAKDFSAVLTLSPKPSWVVRLDIQQLGHFIQPAPKLGDVIAVEGHITNRLIHMSQGSTEIKQVKTLTMDIQNAQKLPYEDMILSSSTEEEEDDLISVSSTPSTSLAPVTSTPGFMKTESGAR